MLSFFFFRFFFGGFHPKLWKDRMLSFFFLLFFRAFVPNNYAIKLEGKDTSLNDQSGNILP